ncbi:unnamed protein product [Nippostrongylus brasiliensis]|uniref:Cofactor of BRCA1 n=1 Tax=Nippostrongylus brasiliensis TaxID=27835 RepID=A0A0N4XCK8_NIPBR|nr:unnamed protein product [Nippostrongylus brasiliensis]
MTSSTPKSLENHALLGSAKLRQTLQKTRKVNTLIAAVKRFQEENQIKMDQLSPALQLLDLHKIKRRDFYEQAASDMSERVVARIRALGENGSPESVKKLEQHLEKCFEFFVLPQFRNIVLETLKQLPKVEDKYLDKIMLDSDFYEVCPLSVKQQIWLRNLDLFKEAYRPFIDSYLKKKEALLLSVEPSATNFFSFETTKARRQWQEIKDLTTSIGNHEELFSCVVTYIREQFAETGNPMLCSLRYELIMAAHDASTEAIVKADPCHDFAWCLEACMRDKHLESHQTNRLRHILDTFAKSTPESAIDLAMVAGDVHVIHFLCAMTVRKLRDSGGAHMPRDMPSIVILVRVLSLGTSAKDLAQMKVQPTEVVDSIFFTKFLPEFTSLMVEDCIRAEIMRSNSSFGEEFVVGNFLSKPSDKLITFLKASRLASLLWYHCCLDMLPSKKRIGDLRGLSRYAESLPLLRDYGDRCVKYQLLRLVSQIGYIWGQPHCLTLLKEYGIDYFTRAGVDDIDHYAAEYNKLYERFIPKPVEMDTEHEKAMPPKMVPGMVPLQGAAAAPLHFNAFPTPTASRPL